MDAAIVGSAQKIEHYEICGYGTARAYAQELGLNEVAVALKMTLDEEYEADDLLAQLAVRRLNKEATPHKGKVASRSNGSGKIKAGAVKSESKRTQSNGSGRSSRKKSTTK